MISKKVFSKNGVPIDLLQTPKGLSTIGLAVPIGSIHSQKSASTSLTLETKLRQAIGSQEQAFFNQLYPTFYSSKEFTTISVNFLPEKEKFATDVLTKLFDGKPVFDNEFKETMEKSKKDDLEVEYTNQQKYFDIACFSSFSDKRYQNSSHISFLDNQTPELNNKLISQIPKQSVLFGTRDMEQFLLKFAEDYITPTNNRPLIVTPHFSPGKFHIPHKEMLLQGTKISMQSTSSLCTVSFPSCGSRSKNKPVYDVLTKIFGGNYSFSSEGLGSGYNTPLYTLLVNVQRMREAFAYNFSLSTNGAFTIGFVVVPEDIKKASKYLKETVEHVLKNINDETLEEAKMLLLTSNQKKLINYAARINAFSASLIYGDDPIVSPKYAEAVRNVSKADVLRAAEYSLNKKPGFCVYGDGNPQDLASAFE